MSHIIDVIIRYGKLYSSSVSEKVCSMLKSVWEWQTCSQARWVWSFTNSRKNFTTAQLPGISYAAAHVVRGDIIDQSEARDCVSWPIRGLSHAAGSKYFAWWRDPRPENVKNNPVLAWTLQNLFILIKLKSRLIVASWGSCEAKTRERIGDWAQVVQNAKTLIYVLSKNENKSIS